MALVRDKFWKDDLTVIFKTNRLIEFVPTNSMNMSEKLNAIARFFIYAGALLYLLYRDVNFLYMPLIVMALSYFVYMFNPDAASQSAGKTDPFLDELDKPTKENPFMNVRLTDIVDNPNKKPADDVDRPDIKKEIEKHFSAGLYKDVDDVWDKENSQRQFYTMPSTTIPNDQDSFAKWCYGTPYTCKDGNNEACGRYNYHNAL
jgi:hypothetical protein